jgi:hypothetical protein
MKNNKPDSFPSLSLSFFGLPLGFSGFTVFKLSQIWVFNCIQPVFDELEKLTHTVFSGFYENRPICNGF